MIIVIARPPAMFLVPSSGGSFANRIGIVRIVRVDAHVEIIVFVRRRTAVAVARAGHVCRSTDRSFDDTGGAFGFRASSSTRLSTRRGVSRAMLRCRVVQVPSLL